MSATKATTRKTNITTDDEDDNNGNCDEYNVL